MSEWAERKSLRLAGHITVGVLALLLILWIVNVFALGNPIAKGAAVGHDTAWIIIAIVLAILLIVLEAAILWPASETNDDWEEAAPVDDWSQGVDDGWTDDEWEAEDNFEPEPVFGTMEEVQQQARTGDKMLGCPDCGTVFLKRAHEIDEQHELDFNCPNCGTDGHFEPGHGAIQAQVHEHTCTRCSYVYEAYQDAHQCPSCHAEQH